MANVLIFDICLMLLLCCVQTCFIPSSLYVTVPQTIPAGYEITKVEVADCDTKSLHFTSRDPSFTIRSNGAVVAVSPVSLAARGRTFSVWAQDNSGPESEMEVHLVHSTMQGREHTGKGFLKRSKRRWSPPPFNILENDVGPYPKEIDKIVSDSEIKHNVYYTLSGPGYNMDPVGVFDLDSKTGMLRVLKAVDRETYPLFQITTRVFDIVTNKETDAPLVLQIVVDDVNDNAPQFETPLELTVPEKSKTGTVVGKVNATDRDQQGSLHVKIKYSLLSGMDLFTINPETGVISTVTNTLDREVEDKHMVTVQIKDLYGAANCLSSTGTVTINLSDINDNPPTFTKESYAVNVVENESEKLVLRIPVEDKDLINTPNWISQFVITKGNEHGNFRIDRDPKTNEGLLYSSKPLDYEKTKNVRLEVMARNQAELSGTTAQWLSIPVDVTVSNVDEGPEFSAPTLNLTVKENTPNGTLIGHYKAVDPETKSSNGIKYYKVTDPGSWINVDRNTGELRVANTIDRESPLLQDGIYKITMKAVDASSKTGTGTVIIKVEDENDNMPEIPGSIVVCEKEGELGSVLIVAEDLDQPPFSSPFSFHLADGQNGKWSLKKFNDTAATLQQIVKLPRVIHDVRLEVRDLQGHGEIKTVKVRICQCLNGACLAKQNSVSFGALAVLAMLLPLALLLLLCILFTFFCMTKGETGKPEIPGESGGILLPSNTEAPGDEVDSSLITCITPFPVDQVEKGSVKGQMVNAGWLGQKSMSTIGAHSIHENGLHQSSGLGMQEFYSEGQHGAQYFGEGLHVGSSSGFKDQYLVQDSALFHNWQTNGCYIHQKLAYLGTEEDGRYADDIIHSYGFEGVGSAAGSVGCCSDIGDSDDLDFLNTLGPKFKTLAGICTKT